ncbi:MAG: hypothetical protein ABFR75_11580 [Acidobacteriota bacterium]
MNNEENNEKENFQIKSEIIHDISRIETILNSGIFNAANNYNPLEESAFIELMILLRDLIYKAEKIGERVNFSDDIITDANTKDVSDTIRHIRDSVCHINSGKRIVDSQRNRVSFCIHYGKGVFANFGDIVLKSDYEDEISFFYGHHQLYLKRHIIRAFKCAKEVLKQKYNI